MSKGLHRISRREEEDEKRMLSSGAWESGYHTPSAHDLNDIRKDHATHTDSGSVSADEAIREVSGTAESVAAEEDTAPSGDTDSSSTKTEEAA